MCVQYIRGGGGGEVFSTSGGYHEYIGEYHEYIRGCSVHQRFGHDAKDIMIHVEGYHEYIGGCSVHRGMFSTLRFSIEVKGFYQFALPH